MYVVILLSQCWCRVTYFNHMQVHRCIWYMWLTTSSHYCFEVLCWKSAETSARHLHLLSNKSIHGVHVITARIRRMGEGNVFSLFTSGGVPVSHNVLQHFPECHGAAGGVPCQVQPGGVPWPGVPWQGGTLAGGVPWLGGTLAGGTLARGVPWLGVPWPGGTLAGGYPGQGGTLARGYPGRGVPWPGGLPWPGGVPWPGVVPWPGGRTQLGQHREYLLHGGRYASCVHAGGLPCWECASGMLKSLK